MENPIKIFEVLKEYSVDFVIIGGHAVNFHGYIRTTEDFDVIVKDDDENKKKLFHALSNINACWITNEINPETKIERTKPVTLSYMSNNHLMMLCTDYGFIDIFDFIPGFPEIAVGEIFDASEEFKGLKYISLDWLIKIKQKSGRPRDLEDIEKLS